MTGDAAKLEAVYREWGPAVRSFLRRRVEDGHAADELLQETFLAVAKNPSALFAAASQKAWLIGIAVNLLKAYRRRRRRDAAGALSDQVADRSPDKSSPEIDLVREGLSRLPDVQREVLDLRLGDELSYEEIAAALGVPIGTVRSRIHHAVLTLRRVLTESRPVTDIRRQPLEKHHVGG